MTPVRDRPARTGPLRLLAFRDFRLLWIGETTSSFGSSVSSVALPLVALTLLHSGVFAISVLTAAAWLPWLVVGPPAGAWVDRLPRRRIMMGADLVSLAVFASVPVAAAVGWLTITQLVIVALLAGTATVFFATAYRAFLPAPTLWIMLTGLVLSACVLLIGPLPRLRDLPPQPAASTSK